MMHQNFVRNYSEGLKYIYSFYDRFRIKLSSSFVTRYFLSLTTFKKIRYFPNIIQITGTNGKGSTCAYLEAFLLSRRHDVICLTSPHINSIRERIRLNGAPISKSLFLDLLNEIYPFLESLRGTQYHPNAFQIMTILSLLLHEKMGRDSFGIYEVGMGGSNDSTNVFIRSIVGMTEITEDHIPELTADYISLVEEKVGLCKPHSVLVHKKQNPEALDIINRYCVEKLIKRISIAIDENELILRLFTNKSMMGHWQLENCMLAMKLAEISTYKKIKKPQHVFQNVRIPIRFENRNLLGKQFILDAAHNIGAVKNLLQFIRYNMKNEKGESIAVVGFKKTKNWREMIDMIIQSNIFHKVIVTTAIRPHGEKPEVLNAYFMSKGLNALPFPSMKGVLNWALNSPYINFFIFGSFALVSDFDRALHSLGLNEYAVNIDEIDPEQPWMNPLI